MRLWTDDANFEPGIGDLVAETATPDGDPAELERGFLVVGWEEPSRAGAAWKVIYERLPWPLERIDWTFFRVATKDRLPSG